MSWKYFCGDFEDVILANLSKMLMVEFGISRLLKSLRSAVHDELFNGRTKNPVNIYLFKVHNRNTRKRSEICSKLTIKTPDRRQWCRSGILTNFEHISHLPSVFVVNFEQVNACWGTIGQMFLPTSTTGMPRAGTDPVQNVSSNSVERSCAVVITTKPIKSSTS